MKEVQMEKTKLDIIRKLMMITTNHELQDISEFVSNAISRECDEDDKDQEEFAKWKKKREVA
jgi:hypothetical protein